MAESHSFAAEVEQLFWLTLELCLPLSTLFPVIVDITITAVLVLHVCVRRMSLTDWQCAMVLRCSADIELAI